MLIQAEGGAEFRSLEEGEEPTRSLVNSPFCSQLISGDKQFD